MSEFDIWPAIIGLLCLGHGAFAVFKGRTHLIRSRDPEAAIYREFQPFFFWCVVGGQIALGLGLMGMAIFI